MTGYEKLRAVLDRAIEQAAKGKGHERHAVEGQPFEEQPIVGLGRWMNHTGFNVGQACKKALESTRLEPAAAVRELLGAINYLAGAVVLLEDHLGHGRRDAIMVDSGGCTSSCTGATYDAIAADPAIQASVYAAKADPGYARRRCEALQALVAEAEARGDHEAARHWAVEKSEIRRVLAGQAQ
jgi:hypothetical protein